MDTLHHGMPATEGGVIDMPALVRALLKAALNEMMDEQADMACEGGANSRNGYRERGLVTPAGKITLRIPKLRCGTYFPDGSLASCSRTPSATRWPTWPSPSGTAAASGPTTSTDNANLPEARISLPGRSMRFGRSVAQQQSGASAAFLLTCPDCQSSCGEARVT